MKTSWYKSFERLLPSLWSWIRVYVQANPNVWKVAKIRTKTEKYKEKFLSLLQNDLFYNFIEKAH